MAQEEILGQNEIPQHPKTFLDKTTITLVCVLYLVAVVSALMFFKPAPNQNVQSENTSRSTSVSQQNATMNALPTVALVGEYVTKGRPQSGTRYGYPLLTYNDPDFNMSFIYPTNWVLRKILPLEGKSQFTNYEAMLSLYPFEYVNPKESIVKSFDIRYSHTAAKTLDEYVKEWKQAKFNQLYKQQIIKEETITIDSVECRKLHRTFYFGILGGAKNEEDKKLEEEVNRSIVWLCVKDGKAYDFNLMLNTADDMAQQKLQKDAEIILNSAKFH